MSFFFGWLEYKTVTVWVQVFKTFGVGYSGNDYLCDAHTVKQLLYFLWSAQTIYNFKRTVGVVWKDYSSCLMFRTYNKLIGFKHYSQTIHDVKR